MSDFYSGHTKDFLTVLKEAERTKAKRLVWEITDPQWGDKRIEVVWGDEEDVLKIAREALEEIKRVGKDPHVTIAKEALERIK